MNQQFESIKCFACQIEILENWNNPREDYGKLRQHLLQAHSIVVPPYTNLTTVKEFVNQTKSLEQLQQEGRCAPFLFKRFDNTLQYFIIDPKQIDENEVKNMVEKNFLETVLNQAQTERNSTTFNRSCLFCRKVFKENRSQIFDHLHKDHNLYLGHPDNILDANEFLNVLEGKLKNLYCLYCERQFKTWQVLKEHMRKKGHKILNPNNREYDKFYLINYLCGDKHWSQIKKEYDFYVDNFNDDWCDWIEDDKMDCLCFFCSYTNKFDHTRQHMRNEHGFQFEQFYSITDFYDRIKMVNFIRKSICIKQCFVCQVQFENSSTLMEHMTKTTDHVGRLPPKELFNSPEYYFPTLDDDCFLLFLDEIEDD